MTTWLIERLTQRRRVVHAPSLTRPGYTYCRRWAGHAPKRRAMVPSRDTALRLTCAACRDLRRIEAQQSDPERRSA